MASWNAPYGNPVHASLEQREQRQSMTYWRVRIGTTLERLEREARRMLQLEQELSSFAQKYYDAVGDAAERLARVEQHVAAEGEAAPVTEVEAAMPAVIAQRDARDARRAELKTRYRSLAKEVHPDRAMVVESAGSSAGTMHALNAAYQHGDLAALLRLEAQMLITRIEQEDASNTMALECALRDVDRAADTYADGYRAMLNSPLNELMLRAMSARLAGWDWMDAVVRKFERTIEEKERAVVMASIAEIGAWREAAQAAA